MEQEHIEEWRAVPGYRRLEVSSSGRARSAWIHKTTNLKPRVDSNGYLSLYVTSIETGIQTNLLLHNLLADAFLGPRPEGAVVGFADGNRANVAISNLVWQTRSDSIKQGIASSRAAGSSWTPRSVGLVLIGADGSRTEYESIKAAAKALGYNSSSLAGWLRKAGFYDTPKGRLEKTG